MKTLLFILAFLSASSSHALGPMIAVPLAAADFTFRCQVWLQGSLTECSSLSVQMLTALDAEWDESQKVLAFFKSDLRWFATDAGTLSWLKTVNLELQLVQQGVSQEFDLYGSAKSFAVKRWPKLDPDTVAHRILAVLLQDNIEQYHVNWLKLVKQQKAKAFAIILKQVLDLLNPRIHSEIDYSRIRIYPPKVEEERNHFNEKMYYYYLPWYLARVTGSAAMPMMMSVIYKYHHAYKKTSDSLLDLGLQTMLRNPEPTMTLKSGKFEVADSAWYYRYRDLYMAYLGAEYATGKTPAWSYPVFEKWIGLFPVGMLQRLF